MKLDNYQIQMLGVILAAIPVLGLTIYGMVAGRATTRSERRRGASGNILPIDPITILLVLMLIAGIFILNRSHFNGCNFLAHWFPHFPYAYRNFLCPR
jgi:hypothetical protein